MIRNVSLSQNSPAIRPNFEAVVKVHQVILDNRAINTGTEEGQAILKTLLNKLTSILKGTERKESPQSADIRSCFASVVGDYGVGSSLVRNIYRKISGERFVLTGNEARELEELGINIGRTKKGARTAYTERGAYRASMQAESAGNEYGKAVYSMLSNKRLRVPYTLSIVAESKGKSLQVKGLAWEA